MAAFLVRFQAIDTAGLAEQDRLNQQLMVRQLADSIRSIDLKLHEMPIEQIGGAHLGFAQFPVFVPTARVKDYEDYLARLNQLPKVLDDLQAVLRQGRADGLMPPRYLLEKTVKQCEAIAAPAGADSPFAVPLKNFGEAIPEAERARLRAAVLQAVDGKVRPAYVALARFIAADYAPHGRMDPGIWAVPGGAELYAFNIEQRTTTSKSPEEIHRLGLAEVARIEGEQAQIARKLGYKSLRAMRAALEKDPKTHARSRQQILDLYRKYIDQMEAKLPELFGLLPKSRVEIQAVE